MHPSDPHETMIYFRSRKYGEVVNSSYRLRSDDEPGDDDRATATLNVGDDVTLLFDVTHEQATAINDMGHVGIRAHNISVSSGDEWGVHIPLRVVKKSHAFAPARGPGMFATLNVMSQSAHLEAENGFWEDVLLWLILGERPGWAPSEGDDLPS